jgi:hypothetical protein
LEESPCYKVLSAEASIQARFGSELFTVMIVYVYGLHDEVPVMQVERIKNLFRKTQILHTWSLNEQPISMA